MDLLDKDASPRDLMSSIKWCVENKESDQLEEIFRHHKDKMTPEQLEEVLESLSEYNVNVLKVLLSELSNDIVNLHNIGEKSWFQRLFLNAIEHGNVDIVIDLIEKGANVNVYHYGKPVLHLAACYGHSEIVEELIKAGSDVTFVDSRGAGIIHSVLSSPLPNKNKMVQQLISLGADPLVKSSSGKLPIHLAAKNSQDVLAMFIQEGHDVNIPDDVNKDTPLHIACGAACQETILTLIQGGCQCNVENIHGQTPLAKVLKFTGKYHDFHAKLRLELAKKLILIGFKMYPHGSPNKSKGRDKCFDRYTALRMTLATPSSLQNLARSVVRELLVSGTNFQNRLNCLDIPANLKTFIQCKDVQL